MEKKIILKSSDIIDSNKSYDDSKLELYRKDKMLRDNAVVNFALHLGGIKVLEQRVCPKCEQLAFFSGKGKSTCFNCGNTFDNDKSWTLKTYLENEIMKGGKI